MQAANTLEDLIERKGGRHACSHRLSYKVKDGRLISHRYNHRSMDNHPPEHYRLNCDSAVVIDQIEIALTFQSILQKITHESGRDPDLSWLCPMLTRVIIETVLMHSYGNLTETSRILGISRDSVRRYSQSKW